MKKIQLIFFLLTICLGVRAQCGPPNYCSRSDTATLPVTSIPKWSAAGSVVLDPTYGNKILRLTDGKTEGGGFMNRSFTTGLGGSGDVSRVWNSDSTLISINDQNGRCFPMTFNPTSFTTSGALYGSSVAKAAFMPGCGVFSTTNPNIFWVLNSTTIHKIDYTNRTVPPTLPGATIYNFAPCAALGTIVWKGIAGPNINDTMFTMSYGSGTQGSAYTIVSYDTVKKVCYNLNTKTGLLKQFASGKFTTIGTVDTPDRFLIHNVKVKDSVAYIKIMDGSCFSACSASTYAYVPGQPKLYPISLKPTGHWASGCSHWLNQNGNLLTYFWKRPFNAQDQLTGVWTLSSSSCGGSGQPACASTFDSHQAWIGDCNDNGFAFMTTVTKNNLINGPWEKEVVGFSTDGSNKQWRFAHTFSSTSYLSDNFSAAEAIGQPDQQGRFYAWTTKAGGQFGCKNGAKSCTQSSQRSDVLVVELR